MDSASITHLLNIHLRASFMVGTLYIVISQMVIGSVSWQPASLKLQCKCTKNPTEYVLKNLSQAF
ncbi:mCG146980 [Mus musculus]|nr:mCG146980 [Mus musculus]